MNLKDTVSQFKGIIVQAGQSLDSAIEENRKQGKLKLDICKQCEHFSMSTRFCKICNCFMPAKTRIPGMECPEKKW
jgi:hypothetical protein